MVNLMLMQFLWGPAPIKEIMAHYHVDADDHRQMVEATTAQLHVVLWLCSVRWNLTGIEDRRGATTLLRRWRDESSEVETDDLWDWMDAMVAAMERVLYPPREVK